MDRYAVIGHPIGHSKSPLIHALFAAATGQALEYTAIEAPLDGFAATVDTFRAAGGRGVNVTVPFKLEACAYATEVSERARIAGAANALAFDGTHCRADNFDGVGLVRDIVTNLRHPIAGKRVLMLGAGGAARGALQPLLAAGPTELFIANRSAAKAAELANAFHALGLGAGVLAGGGWDDLAARGAYDIVINATSASLTAEPLPLPPGVFGHDTLAYDMVYGKGLTPFLRQARDAGAGRLADGLGMLVEQAAETFAWWRGVRPTTLPVIERLRVPLA
ncbi:shikimate dehydrogenase [Tepidimonas taiwanensis]|uniref:shikimate dehydrogenase n=1 Tax=Tepidimonas taiwanensis TaxID=307486 RepID=UPI0007348CB3|nr:shikimate dehydrogenase [Tepidimonas taiwanensis]MCX7692126.1 shikimate dehydrogenase [Tepidimonas taiwanensis]MDM7463603.1 shikimate dehydrogenase [Tepidimonas taiwanensis]